MIFGQVLVQWILTVPFSFPARLEQEKTTVKEESKRHGHVFQHMEWMGGTSGNGPGQSARTGLSWVECTFCVERNRSPWIWRLVVTQPLVIYLLYQSVFNIHTYILLSVLPYEINVFTVIIEGSMCGFAVCEKVCGSVFDNEVSNVVKNRIRWDRFVSCWE